MENKFSILDQIISNKRNENVDNLDAVQIINDLFSELTERERDILVRRHGLNSGLKETLENIGAAHKLTRERIRQIETHSIKKLRNLTNLEKYLMTLKKVIFQLLEEHGGMMEKEFLMEILVNYSLDNFNVKIGDKLVHKNYINFLITELLHDEFEEVNNSGEFKEYYKLKYQDIQHLEELAKELHDIINKLNKAHTTEEIMALMPSLESYIKNKEKFIDNGGLDIARAIKRELFSEDPNLINGNKILYSILRSARNIEQNKFGHWGGRTWKEIKPKTINDKIYLVLKHHKKPLHFGKIAEIINEIGFDEKKANAATVHNELILDTKYVLVGRGLYGLREWGYKKGNVVDVIQEVLNEAGRPLDKDEIIEGVLAKRVVKKATIVLALMNRDKFIKEGNKYQINPESNGEDN